MPCYLIRTLGRPAICNAIPYNRIPKDARK
jgi:hypothetical protein